MNTKAFRSRSVLITGCSSGFGRQMVSLFLRDGWTVFATLRRAHERRGIFKDELARFPSHLVILECDVTSTNDRQAVRRAMEATGKGLDCLINNAGYMLLGAFEDTTEDQFRKELETNFFGAVLLTQELLPLLRQNRGTIVNVSSVYGFTTWPLTSAYCASKYALEGFTQSLRQELEPHGVRVALLEPGSCPTSLMDHLDWGNRLPFGNSAYRAETQGYMSYRKALASRKPDKGMNVARAALKIARSGNPRLRNRVGLDSKLVHLATRIFPEIFGVSLMGWVAQRILRKALAKKEGHPS